MASAIFVRRHIIWNKQRPDLKEDLAHLVQDIKRRICGIASAGLPTKWSKQSKSMSTRELAKIAKNQTVMVVCHP